MLRVRRPTLGQAGANFPVTPNPSSTVIKLAWRQALLGAGITLGLLGILYGLLAAHQIWFAEHAEVKCPYHTQRKNAAMRQQNSDPESATNANVTELRVYRYLAWLLGPGYFREVVYHREDGPHHQIVLAPGHASLMVSTTIFLCWYAWNYWSVLRDGKMPDESSVMPALSFGLLSLLLVILVLPGISFLLDRHRTPILPTLLLLMAAFYGVFATDHYYELNPPAKCNGSRPPRSQSTKCSTAGDSRPASVESGHSWSWMHREVGSRRLLGPPKC